MLVPAGLTIAGGGVRRSQDSTDGIKRSENLHAWVRAGDEVTQGRAVKLRLLLYVLVNFRCWKIASLGYVVASLLARRSPRHLATEE
jgi:hypothetical protein